MVLESNTLDVLFVKDGQQGEDGKVLYTWIKYAKDANGTGMTDDPNGAIYIGISYNNESSSESNDPTQYAWTKIQGADGKKGEDAYTIFLENENISFATDKNRNPLSEQAYTSGITIMKGAKPVTDFTIGDIAKTQGIAVAKTDTAIAISVINGNPLPSDNGEIVIPITVGGTVFKKILSWTCAKKGDQGIQGPQGEKGEQGIAGKDGTSVTIINKSITYQLSTSGTVIPTGTWQTSPQTIPEGQYQWTKTSVTYSDGNKTESYSISYHGKNGSDGTSVKTTSTSVKYQVGDSGTTKPTGTWQSNVPTVAQGKYLWTQTIVNYSDGNSTESYGVSYRGIDGSNGVNGMNAATIYLYQRATSTPSKPSNTLTYTFSTTKITGTLNNGWSTAIPTGTDAVYVTVASVSSKNDTATIATSAWSAPVVLVQNGKTGSDGKAGLNVATIYLYQRNTSKPSKPSASVTYTFSTGVASGLNNGWSQKIPDGTNPLYVTLATASSNTATDTILSSEWSDVVVMAQNGEDGISPKVSLSKTGGTTTISIVDATGTHTQTVKDGINGTPGEAGKDGKTSYFHVKYSNDGGKTFTGNSGEDTGIYMGSYTDYTEADSTDVSKYTWVKVKGDKGDTGQKGQDGTSIKITSKSVTYQTSTSGTIAPTGTWSTIVPAVNNGQYLWTKTTVQYSDGNKTEAYSVSYKGTNGTNGTSVTVSKTEVTYQVSTSGTTAPTGAWQTTMPSCDQGQYLWTKTYVKYSDGKDTTSYSVSYKGVDGEKFAFNMLRETNQGSKHWVNMGASGKYSVESITTEDSINAVKLICTEPIASNEWQFCDFSDYEMLRSLKASTTYTLSYDIKTNRSGKILHNIKTGGGQKMFFVNDIACKVLGNETWEHVSLKMTSGTTLPNLDGQVIYMFGDALSKVGYSIIKNLKLTEGIIDTPWAPHPEDLEGRGVSETVQYYLATSQASGVTSSTSGWSTDITTQKLTADKKYLWNCYQTKYSDGTSEPISTPKVIGVYGDKGQKGDSGEDGQDGAGFHWNLLSGTKDFDKTKMSIAGATSFDSQKYLGLTVIKAVSPTSGYIDPVAWNSTITPTPNTQYTISFYAKASVKTLANSYFYPNCTIKCISNHQTTTAPDGGVSTMLSTEWERYSVTWTTSGSVSGTKSIIPVRLQHGISVDGATVYLCGVKLEQSDKPSPWCTTYEETLAKNLSITPSSQYFKSTDGGKTFAPNTITIKPTIQGEISFGKWQYSIDGGVSFADVVSGQKGLTISNNVLTVSKDSSLYSDAVTMITFRAVADDSSFYDTCSIAKIYDVSDIGDGRNLLWNSNFAKTDEAITGTTNSWGLHTRGTNLVASIDTSTKHNGFNTLKTVSAANGDKNSSNDLEWFAWGISERTSDNLHSKNQNYTLSFYAKASVTTDFIVRWGYDAYGADTTRTLTTNWQKYEIKLHQATSAYSITIIFKLLTAGTVWFSEFKLEKGSSATGYSTAPEDLQTAILSTKSEISDVSLKVDKNKQAIEQRVEKTTYQQDLNLVKGDISKANEGLNKWRYEIYPKSLFASEYQGKSTMDVFAKNTNLTPSQSVLINDTDFGKSWAYGDNYIGYALTFVKFSAAKSIAITFKHDDGAHLYLNGKLIGGDDRCNTGSGESLTLSFIQGWNCLEVVLNEKSGSEYIGLGTTISAISECQLMNCYYGTPVARQSHITNQLVQNTTDIDGVSTKVSKVTSVIGDNGENFTSFKNDYSDFKQTMNGFKTTVGQTYVTKDDFNGLEIGGRNLVRLGGLSSNGATSFSYDKTTDIYTIVSPVVSTVWGIGAAVKYDDNHKVLIPYGKTYILSFEVKVPQALSINIDINNFAVSGSSWAGNDNDDGSMRGQSSYNIPANTWTKVWVRWANTNTKNTNKVDLYDNSSIGLVTKDCTSAITWQIRHVKGELGNKPTDWTPAPEDVNGKIVNVETIANQTAKKFEWIVKGGDSSSNFTLTDRVADLVAERINFKGLVTFSGLNTDAKNEIGKVAQSKVDGLEIGGRNLIINSNLSRTLTNVTNDGCSNMTVVSDSVYGHALKFTAVNQRGVFWATSNVWVKNKTYTVSFVAKSSVTGQKIRPSRSTADWGDDITLTTSYARYTTKITSLDTNAGGTLSFSCTNAVGDITITNVKLEVGNKATDWTPAPEDLSQDATNKASQALTDAKNYSSNAVNWVTNNGSSTTSLNSMVKKWTDGAVSDTAHINGGWIKANTITASKIALADFTNYSQLTRDTADAYGFTVTDDTDGTWFSTKNIKRDQFISEIFPCNGGESYLIEYDISTNAKGANNSTDTKNYIGVAIGVYGYTGTVGSNGLPNKATNIWYADRITGSETAPSIHVKTTITTSTATKQFRVFLQSNGYYFEGTTKIRNLSVRRMYGGTLIVDGSITADKIATDAIKSRNYISSGGTQGSFLNLSDGSFQSPNLSWDSNGNLIAKNANLSGEITATNGSIAGWTIISNKMYTTGSGKYTGIGKYGSAYAFWAGATSNDNGNSAVFKVSHTGKLTATDADITGTITATNGKIGRYDITSTYLMTNSGSNASGIGGNQAFWAGAEDSNSAPFRVGYDGVLWAENAAIRGSIETGNLGDEGDTVSIINGHIGIQGTSNNVEIYSTGFKFGIDGDYYLMSVSEGVKCYRNLYATDFVADGWLYCSEVHSSGAVVIGADSESFYWAHGYQIARGTSWGGVCVGDDSQQLRLYGSSIWASHSISTSDENLKENFTTLDQYENFYMNLNPIGFNYIGDYDGKKTHFGFGAHKTEDVLESEGYDADKFAVVTHRPLVQEDIEKRFGKDVEVDIETEYGVSYTEFIALNTHMIQKTRRELTKVKQEKADLEVRLQAIEAKLGL